MSDVLLWFYSLHHKIICNILPTKDIFWSTNVLDPSLNIFETTISVWDEVMRAPIQLRCIFSYTILANLEVEPHALKVVLGGFPRCPDNHDMSKCHRLYDLGRHIEQP